MALAGGLILVRKASPARGALGRTSTWLPGLYLVQVIAVAAMLLAILRGASPALGDWLEVPTWTMYALIAVAVSLSATPDGARGVITVARASLVIIVLLLALYLFARSSAIGRLLFGQLYGGTKTFDYGGAIRFAAPFENPNHLSFAISGLAVIASLPRDRQRYMPRALWPLLAAVAIPATGSRTGLLAFIAGALTWGLIRRSAGRGFNLRRTAATVGVAVMAFIGAMALPESNYVTARYEAVSAAYAVGGIEEVLRDRNTAARLTQYRRASTPDLAETVIGRGPTEAAGLGVVDNQLIRWFTRAGVLGVLAVASSLGAMTLLGVSRRVVRLRVPLIVGTGIFLLTGSYLSNFRLWTIFLIATATLAYPAPENGARKIWESS